MKFVAKILSAALALSASAWAVHAQETYPSRPVRVICAYVAGGGGDIMVRYWANALKSVTGQNFIVENRVGANGHLGNRAAMEARPDGYTMIITGTSALVGNPLMMKGADYDPLNALQAVATLNDIGLILVVNPASDIKTLGDLTAFIKAKKGEAKYAVATASHRVVSAWYLQLIGAEATAVGYKATSDATNDIAAGLLDFVFADATLAMTQSRAGRARMLATSTKDRVSFAPDVPTMVEAGVPGLDYSVKWGAWFPKGTPEPIVKQMHAWLSEIAQRPESKKFLYEVGSDPYVLPNPAAMDALIKHEYETWKDIVERAKIEKQ